MRNSIGPKKVAKLAAVSGQPRPSCRMKAKPTPIPFVADDGGRAAANIVGGLNDCAFRAMAIATGMPYADVAAAIERCAFRERRHKRHARSTMAAGVRWNLSHRLLASWGWTFKEGKVHLSPDELPAGRIIVKMPGHLAAVVDGVLRDTWDCSRGGRRVLSGYFIKLQK